MVRSSAKNAAFAAMVFCAMLFFSPAKSFANEKDWAFVQSIGGMRLGQLQKHSDEWMLTVDIDVMGLRTITTKPTAVNSGIICEGIGADIEDNNIYLALYVGQPWIGVKNGECPPISLGQPTPGTYTVYYSGLGETPVRLGEISIGPF